MTRRFALYGHRGARGRFPENTMDGFARALAMGVDAFELDVGVTADDVAVVCHDPALNPDIARGPDGAWIAAPGPLLRDLSFAELASYDVGRRRPGSPTAAAWLGQVAIDGARVPRLTDVLRIDPAVRFLIELKTDPEHPARAAAPADMADRVLAAVDAAGVAGRVMVESFDWRGPRHLRRLRPGLPLALLTAPATVAAARLWWDGPHPDDFGGSVPRAVAAEAAAAWAPAHADLTREHIAEAQALGLRVLPWTVNDAADMRRLIRWGVDGFITDYPDRARVAMAREGLAVPPVRAYPSP